jgi:hypothetical protein
MKVINMRKGNDNPFYGKNALLNLNKVVKAAAPSKSEVLNSIVMAKKEAKTKEDLQLLYSILFSVGDVPGRVPNMFGKNKVDDGGHGKREIFLAVMQWMQKEDPKQYNAFLTGDLFRQYACLYNVVATQVKTKKGTTKIESVLNMLKDTDLNVVADYIAAIIRKSNPVERTIIAKWLVYPRTSKRQKLSRKNGERIKGGRALQAPTKENMNYRVELYKALSERMSWTVIKHKQNYEFEGLKNWKKEYNGELESVLFSSGKITEFDNTQFIKWLDTLPAGARFRTRRRLLDKDDKCKGEWKSKFGEADMGQWFLDWEAYKADKQKEQRVLTERVRQGTATEADTKKLEKVKKEAKVTTGGANIVDLLMNIRSGLGPKAEGKELLIQSLLDKVNFEVPVLMIADNSGSMRSADGGLPAFIASILATIVMTKNPSPDLDNVLVTFDSQAIVITDGMYGQDRTNRFMQGKTIKVDKLVDRTRPFVENWLSISRFVNGNGGSTCFDGVADAFKSWVESASDDVSKQVRIECIQQYPVFLVVSDGDFNGDGNATQVMAKFQQNMRQWFGWEGVVVIWDVSVGRSDKSSFDQLPNVVHPRGFELSTVNQIFTKIHDLDVIDVYTELKSLYESNRYEPVRMLTL